MERKTTSSFSLDVTDIIINWCEDNNCCLHTTKGYTTNEYRSVSGSHARISHITALKIPEGIHEIPEGAFIGSTWDNLKTITVPTSIVKIEKGSIRKSVKLVIPMKSFNNVINDIISNSFNFSVEFESTEKIENEMDELIHLVVEVIGKININIFDKSKSLTRKELRHLIEELLSKALVYYSNITTIQHNSELATIVNTILKYIVSLITLSEQYQKLKYSVDKKRSTMLLRMYEIKAYRDTYRKYTCGMMKRDNMSCDEDIVLFFGKTYDEIEKIIREFNNVLSSIKELELNLTTLI